MILTESIQQLCQQARRASVALAKATPEQINQALEAIAQALEKNKAAIQAANAQDLQAGEARGLSGALLERLRLKDATFQQMTEGLRQVVQLPNPVGEVIKAWTRPNGLRIRKVRVPIGVIGIIYESRPNVTVDAAALCLKTGNATILRGGSEAFHSNQALAIALAEGLHQAGLPEQAIQLIPTTDREVIPLLCQQDRYIDLLIPRGGHGLIETVVKAARMPVIKHYNGICHVYVHADADLAMAETIVMNAKCQRPATCNAAETILIDDAVATTFVPQIVKALRQQHVEVRGDTRTVKLGGAEVKLATEEDWQTEYLDLIVSIRVVRDLAEAMEHIEHYGSKHSDTIVTENAEVAEQFLNEVDASCVFWNASTRFNDGFELGFGAEIGISTDKLHARGPMGLEELTSYKYQIVGTGKYVVKF